MREVLVEETDASSQAANCAASLRRRHGRGMDEKLIRHAFVRLHAGFLLMSAFFWSGRMAWESASYHRDTCLTSAGARRMEPFGAVRQFALTIGKAVEDVEDGRTEGSTASALRLPRFEQSEIRRRPSPRAGVSCGCPDG